MVLVLAAVPCVALLLFLLLSDNVCARTRRKLEETKSHVAGTPWIILGYDIVERTSSPIAEPREAAEAAEWQCTKYAVPPFKYLCRALHVPFLAGHAPTGSRAALNIAIDLCSSWSCSCSSQPKSPVQPAIRYPKPRRIEL